MRSQEGENQQGRSTEEGELHTGRNPKRPKAKIKKSQTYRTPKGREFKQDETSNKKKTKRHPPQKNEDSKER